jgi:hypothetical protein
VGLDREPACKHTCNAGEITASSTAAVLAAGMGANPEVRAVSGVGLGTGHGPGSKATQFKPKVPGGAVRRRRPAAGPQPPQLLRDMRFVYSHSDERDRTEGHRNCRAWLSADAEAFMEHLAKMVLTFE